MGKTSITNVRVFDGEKISEPRTVAFDDGVIAEDPSGASGTVDSEGGVLLPGFIDAHVHLHGEDSLKELAKWGVTTGLDMAKWPPKLTFAIAPGNHIFPISELVANGDEAEKFVASRVAESVDYIKIIADLPGFDQSTINTLVSEAKRHGKMIIAHAAHYPAFDRALEGKVDIIAHVPLDKALDKTVTDMMISQQVIAVPTLSMMEKLYTNLKRPGADYAHARNGIKAMHEAGVPILAGTDSNNSPGAPAQVKHGESLHHEFELLIAAGLSTLKVLRAATAEPAKFFGLHDRGVVEVGKRADLVLIRVSHLRI